jgi:nucleoside-diphosphate-sugar epimerase
MILFTGSGQLAFAFAEMYDCKIISARNLDDINLSDAIRHASVIIHNAALIDSKNVLDLIEANFILTTRIVEIVRNVNPDVKFINISSMSFLKDENNYLPTESMSDYAYSKYIAETYCKRQPLNAINVRFSTIFYGNEKKDGLSKLVYDCIYSGILTIYNDGTACSDFIPLPIACQYLYKIAISDFKKNVINLVSGDSVSFKFFVERLVKLKPNTKVINVKLDTPAILCDFSKKDIRDLGEITFNMDELFDNFFYKLNENFNL